MAKHLFKAIAVDKHRLRDLYVDKGLGLIECGRILGVSTSTARLRLLEEGLLRSPGDGVRLSIKRGRAKPRPKPPMSQAARDALSKKKTEAADATAAGVSRKPNGYIEYTRGPNKGRSVHVVTMEELVGRRIRPNEVVHHKDENRQNNHPSNLQLMTRSEHSSLHAREAAERRKRNSYGKSE